MKEFIMKEENFHEEAAGFLALFKKMRKNENLLQLEVRSNIKT